MTVGSRSARRSASPVVAGVGVTAYLAVVACCVLTQDRTVQVVVPLLAAALLVAAFLRWPVAAFAVLLLGSVTLVVVTGSSAVGQVQTVVVAVGVGGLAATRRPAVSGPGALLAVVAQSAASLYVVSPAFELPWSVAVTAIAVVAGWSIGFMVRQRRAYAGALQAQIAARAAIDERLRIARDLHDVLAHTVGVIAIQAGMGARVIDTQPEVARSALATIEGSSRETLLELRRTLGRLRTVTDDPPVEAGVAQLGSLVARTADAGVRVAFSTVGQARLPADVDAGVYRIAQEALTNVVRHAGVPTCTMTVTLDADEVVLEVADDGRGPVGPADGYGVLGMRERVALLGGALEAGAGPAGVGYRVRATIPVAATPPR